MNTIERSVRRALQKGDASDPKFRLLVYEAAERAINRTETERRAEPGETDRQRKELIAAVEAIEADYPASNGSDMGMDTREREASSGPATPVKFDDLAVTTSDEMSSVPPDQRVEPATLRTRGNEAVPPRVSKPQDVLGADIKRHREGEADAARPAAAEQEGRRAERGKKPQRGESRWARRTVGLLIVALIAFLLIVGAYLVIPLLLPSGLEETTERDPIADTIRASDAASTGEDGWTVVFRGEDISGLSDASRPGAAVVEGAGGRSAVRVRQGSTDSPVRLVIPAEALSALAGSTARGELTVGSPDGKSREFTVECVLDAESLCGRQRFTTSRAQEVFVFEMTIPSAVNDAGELVIDSRIGETAADLDLYGFRVRVV